MNNTEKHTGKKLITSWIDESLYDLIRTEAYTNKKARSVAAYIKMAVENQLLKDKEKTLNS